MTRRFINRAPSLPATSLATLMVALGLAACAQAAPSGPNPLAGINENRELGQDLRIANGVCFQKVNDEKGWFITNRQKCVAALER